jgi:hypothetical protein
VYKAMQVQNSEKKDEMPKSSQWLCDQCGVENSLYRPKSWVELRRWGKLAPAQPWGNTSRIARFRAQIHGLSMISEHF